MPSPKPTVLINDLTPIWTMPCAQAQAKIEFGWDKTPYLRTGVGFFTLMPRRHSIASSEPERLSVGRL
jgi:hypothetical protein